MNKEKLLQLLEEELVQADEASSNAEFDKHMYTIYKLTALYTGSTDSITAKSSSERPKPSVSSTTQQTNQVTDEEIRMMGGKVSSSTPSKKTKDNRMVTDDEIGNGESIFDF